MTTAEGYAFCRDVARREAKNFYWAFRVLPRAKSDAMCAVYAFMRKADDLADDETKTIEERGALMAEWVSAWRAQQGKSETADPVFAAVGDTQRRFGIPDDLLEELVRGTTMDLEPRKVAIDGVQTYATFEELYEYCYLVASVVGLVCIRIFGYSDVRAEGLAEETGIAFQLTNVLRDVKEDVERGRVYLPVEMMDEFGVSVDRLRAVARGAAMGEGERSLLATLGIRAERYYLSGRKLIPLLDRDSRAAMWVLLTIYHGLLREIAARKMDVFRGRVGVSTARKLWILLRGAGMAAWNRVIP